MEEAMAHQNELEDSYRRTQQRLEDLQEKLREHQDRLQSYKNRKLELSKQELEVGHISVKKNVDPHYSLVCSE